MDVCNMSICHQIWIASNTTGGQIPGMNAMAHFFFITCFSNSFKLILELISVVQLEIVILLLVRTKS